MTQGIHHVTAIASDPQRNIDFYVGVLGLHLVKKTVNFDDPASYHFYYGDAVGRPGTIITFFSWPERRQGGHGNGQVAATGLSVPEGSLEFWRRRVSATGTTVDGPTPRFDEEVLSFADPDGLRLELISRAGASSRGRPSTASVPEVHAVRGLHSVSMRVRKPEDSVAFLTEHLAATPASEDGNRFRVVVGDGGPAASVDLLVDRQAPRGKSGVGTVHHLAWRAATDAAQVALRGRLADAEVNVTQVLDRSYFKSIYFREPGGILFEVATDAPGFAVDEPAESLGQELKLPEWLEPERAAIEASLPSVQAPRTNP